MSTGWVMIRPGGAVVGPYPFITKLYPCDSQRRGRHPEVTAATSRMALDELVMGLDRCPLLYTTRSLRVSRPTSKSGASDR